MKISPSELRRHSAIINNAREDLLSAGNMALSAIRIMNDGMDQSLEYNLSGKVSAICQNLTSLISTLNAAHSTANAVADAFEGTDSELQKQVENMDTYLINNYPGMFSDDAKRSHSNQEVMTAFEEKVENLKNTEGFQQGDINTNSFMDGVEYYKGSYIGASQCCAMARMMQVEVMGKRGYDTKLRSWNDIKVGDVINYTGCGADPHYGHWVFVTEVHGDKIVVSEGNFIPSTVTHGREISQGSINIRQIDRVV